MGHATGSSRWAGAGYPLRFFSCKAIFFVLFLFFVSIQSFAAKKYSTANGDWTAPGTWFGNAVPTNNDTVFILKQHTVRITSNVNLGSSYIFLVIVGTLDFTTSNNGKLDLNASSKIIIETGGLIKGDGSSDQISIGSGGAEYSGSLGNRSGPSYISNGHTPVSGEGLSGCGCYNGIGVASCTITSSTTPAYTVHVLVWARKILVETNPCTNGYNYDVRMDYSVQFTGTPTLYTLQGYINCGSASMYFDLPEAGGVGTVDSQGNAWRGVNDCGTATPTSLNCMNASIEISGLGILHQYCATPLPIELMSFTGEQCADGTCLTWSTASEKNFDKFIIERSNDGLIYDSVGTITGSGNSKLRLDYQFRDFNPTLGKNYYRLKSVDFDFSFEYSNVILINFIGEKNIVVFPNPLQENTLKFRSNFVSAEGDKVEIFDNVGLKIMESNVAAGADTHAFNSFLKPGSYLLRYTSEGYSRIVRFTSK